MKYIKIHNIDEESIRNASNYLTCLFCPKNKHVFHQLDESDAFYGIIKGKISLQSEIYQYEDKEEKREINKRKKTVINLKTPLNSEEKFTLIEETIFVLSDGYCFGEWGLVNETRRVTSAKAIEDTYLFVLEKKDFKSTLYHCYFKLIADRNNFIKNNIIPMKNCLNAIYNKLSPLITPLVFINNPSILIKEI
jgi:CRP-like cAMP-binding protein